MSVAISNTQARGPSLWQTWIRRFWDVRFAVFTFVLLVFLWEFLVYWLQIAHYLLPPPSKVVTDLMTRWPRVIDGAIITTQEIILGYALAIVVSIPLALAIAYSLFLEKTAYPVLVFLQIIPKIAIAPLFVIWFGFGLTPKVLVVFLLAFFPVIVSSIAAFRSVSDDILDLARSTGAGHWMVFRKITLPHALPQIFTGLKVGASIAPTAAIVAEFVASDSGLGYLLLEFNGDLETAMVFAIILILGVIGMALYYLVVFAERLLVPWHVSHRRAASVAGSL